MMRTAGPGASGDRMRALVVALWRAGLRIGEALALVESDLDPSRGSILVRHGKGDKRRESGMDDWAWNQGRALAGGAARISCGTALLRDHGSDSRPAVVAERRAR